MLTQLQRSYLVGVITIPAFWLVKLSIFSLIYCAFRPLTYIRWLVYAGLVVTGLYTIAVSVANGVLCAPKGGQNRDSWMAGASGHTCAGTSGRMQQVNITTGAFNLLWDLYLFVLPLRPISQLNMPRGKKTGVFLIFLTGAAYVHMKPSFSSS